MDSEGALHIRLAQADDDAFILDLVGRFVDFPLPAWRKREVCFDGIHTDLDKVLSEQPPGSHVFVAEDDSGNRVGFLHLNTAIDYFTGAQNCHISDLAVARQHDGRGIGRGLLAYAERWAKQHNCRYVTLNVFPDNTRGRELYERAGYGTDMLRMLKVVR
ncbi:MAG: GNAT family N-acetyltransferase [Dokdonella sp.]